MRVRGESPLTRIAPDDASHRRGNPTSPRKRGEVTSPLVRCLLRHAPVRADGDGEANVRTNWAVEIYDDSGRKSSLISVHEVDDFPSLRTKIVENPAFRFLIHPPDHATSSEFQCLLDLRGQGFKVERK